MTLIKMYENRLKHGRTLFIAGIPMLFETLNYAIHIGIIMMISGIIIIRYYNKKIIHEKNKEIIISFLEEVIKKLPFKEKSNISNKKQIEPKIKELKVYDYFGKIYQNNNTNININNIDTIMYYNNIDYDKITLLLDIFMFVSKYKIIMDLKMNLNNKLLDDYYNHYCNIISYISNININNMNEISTAINYMADDYYNNMKILDNIINNIDNSINNYYNIKLLNNIFNNIIMENFENLP